MAPPECLLRALNSTSYAKNQKSYDILISTPFLKEGQFVWLSGDPIVFNSYNSGQPDNDDGTGGQQDCIDLFNEPLASKTFCWLYLNFSCLSQ